MLLVVLPDAIRGFKAVHDWHEAVQEDDAVGVTPLLMAVLHFLDGLLAIVRTVNQPIQYFEFLALVKYLGYAYDVVLLVVHYENALVKQIARGSPYILKRFIENELFVVVVGGLHLVVGRYHI